MLKMLNAKAHPLAYVVTGTSTATGLLYAYGALTSRFERTVLYEGGVAYIGLAPWALILLVSSCIQLYGLFVRNKSFVRYTALTNFAMWLFASVTYLQKGYVSAAVAIAAVHLLAQMYFYLAVALDRLWEHDVE